MAWHPLALLGLASGIVSWVLAAIVYRSRPDRRQNRILAAWLTLTGTAWFLSRGALPLADSAGAIWGLSVTYYVAHVASHVLHLRFLATLDSPWTRWLSKWPGQVLQVAIGLLALALVVRPEMVWSHVVSGGSFTAMTTVPQPDARLHNLFFGILWAYGALAAIDVYRHAGGRRGARSVKAYLAAFLVHDAAFALMLANILLGGPGQSPATIATILWLTPPIANLWLVSWLSYGILHDQLFDIDIKLKIGISRGTVAAVIAGAALVGGEAMERLVGADGMWSAVGIGALTALAFRPIARLGDKIADRALPGVADTADYRTSRAQAIYDAAVREAGADGAITARETRLLDRLRVDLGLSDGA